MKIPFCRMLPLTFLPALALAFAPAAMAHPEPCEDLTPIWHLWPSNATEAQPNFALPAAVFALWRPGSGTVPDPAFGLIETNDSKAKNRLQSQVNAPADGKSIVDFERYVAAGGQVSYALVYAAAEGAESLSTNLSEAQFQNGFQASQGADAAMHLVDFESFTEGGERHWAALYGAGHKSQTLELELTGSTLKSRVELPDLGKARHLVAFEKMSSDLGGNPIFAALYETGAQEQRFFPALSSGDFHDLIHDDKRYEAGFRLTHFETWRLENGESRYAALLEQIGGDDHLWGLVCPNGSCSAAATVAASASHLGEVIQAVAGAKSGLRVVNLEIPLGKTPALEGDLPLSSGLAKAPAPQPVVVARAAAGSGPRRTRGGGGPAAAGGGKVVTHEGPPPTCTHAGVLHDGGTNGPPNP